MLPTHTSTCKRLTKSAPRAWEAGWDVGARGLGPEHNPYQRRSQREAWERGRVAGQIRQRVAAPDEEQANG